MKIIDPNTGKPPAIKKGHSFSIREDTDSPEQIAEDAATARAMAPLQAKTFREDTDGAGTTDA